MNFDAKRPWSLSAHHQFALRLTRDETKWWRKVLCYVVGWIVGPLK